MFLGSEKIYPVELQDRARLHFPYTSSTYYHVESVLQKRLKRQDHPLLIVSIYFYNTPLSSYFNLLKMIVQGIIGEEIPVTTAVFNFFIIKVKNFNQLKVVFLGKID